MHVQLFTDGGARGNPGHAGIGFVIRDDAGHEIAAHGEYLGIATNNQAEYRAMLDALLRAQELGATDVEAFADSELLVKQLNREYKIRNQTLAGYVVKIWNVAQAFDRVTFTHVRREKNTRADELVNRALDERLK
jgi:ribonuclease HI